VSDALLQVDNLTTDLPTTEGYFRAVDGVGFEVREGEVCALLGESGCGKTMTALSVLRLVDPRARLSGQVRLAGEDLLALSPAAMRGVRGARIALVPQSPFTALDPAYRIGDQVSEALRAHNGHGGGRRTLLRCESRRSTVWRQAVELLAQVEIAEPEQAAERYPHEFSGGMCQRAVIATALAGSPRVIIADEPTTALDVTVQRDIVRLLDHVRRERQLGILLISHDFALVAEFADRAVVLYAGQVVERAPTATLLSQPLHPYTQALLACVPSLEGRGVLKPIPGSVPPRYDRLAGCRFAERCPRVCADCRGDVPELRTVGEDHDVRCILYDSH
jgi:oligopeptide/dipeptide ABC transporter ATP-binding protein